MRSKFLFLPLTLLLLCGCGPSPQQQAETILLHHGQTARQQLGRLTVVLDHCRQLPALADEDLPERLDGVCFASDGKRIANARTLWLDAYDGGTDNAEPYGLSSVDRWWSRPAGAIAGPLAISTQYEADSLSSDILALAATQYVLVLRTVEYHSPRQIGSGTMFNFGAVRAEGHLYDLASGRRLGGMLFNAYGQIIGPLGLDLTIDGSDPQRAVQQIRQRLYQNTHEFAQGHLALRVAGVSSPWEVEVKGPFLADELRLKDDAS